MDNVDAYFSGRQLYGDDFNESQIAAWYADEKEGYANLGARNASTYRYAYHAQNVYHAYRHLRAESFPHVMGFGSAYGDELLPIISRIGMLTIVDPSDAFVKESVHGVPAQYVRPVPSGKLPMDDDTFDLITCIGVLHHIPNVSFVVSELARTLKPGSQMILKEPINSMGDWRKSRPGLTARERGIPLGIFRSIVRKAGLVVDHESLHSFSLTPRLFSMFKSGPYNSTIATRVDALLSAGFAWNVNYHPRSFFQRLRPIAVCLVLHKPLTSSKARVSSASS